MGQNIIKKDRLNEDWVNSSSITENNQKYQYFAIFTFSQQKFS